MAVISGLSARTLEVSSSAIPGVFGRPALEPVRLSGTENVNGLFEYRLRLKTPDAMNVGTSGAIDFDLDDFIGREISCTIQLDGMGTYLPGASGANVDRIGAGTRQINALITAATLWGEEGRHVRYELTLAPWLHLATLCTNTKVYQNKSVVQILDELLYAYPFPVDKRLIETYAARDYQTQFNESDHAFFERMTQENGISYFFEHSDGKHRLVLIDNFGAYKQNDSAAYQQVEYHPPGWKADAEYIHSFVPRNQLTSGKYSTRDYDYTRPRADLRVSRAEHRPTGQAGGEVYQWHDGTAGSHYAQPRAGTGSANDPLEEGRQFALLRMQALRTHGARATASGNLRGMVPGCFFKLARHPRQTANTEYLILETQLLIEDVAQDSQIKDATADRKQAWRVQLDFTAHPMSEPLRPALTRTKPYSHGPQVALVVGPAGENLWTDSLGRIKVQFPWDRIGGNDANSSCWVRVSSPWAGNQLGGVYVPRIGQEVIVDFIGGDMDLPVCTGRVHNQNNLPPWELPGQSALSGFRSRELVKEGGNGASGRSNHLLMDDTAEQIQAQLKSDHQSSSLSLGHITRVEDNGGRKEPRGEGFELRTDSWGAVRTNKGLLLCTDGRPQAVGGILSRDELASCLKQALALAEELGKAAADNQGATRETIPQQELSQAVDALGHGANDELDAKGKGLGEQAVLAISGAAGIASTTPRTQTQYAGQNIDSVASRNQQQYAGHSIFQSAGKDIEQFAVSGDIRIIANQGKVIQQAQHNTFEITGQKDVTITSAEEGIVVRAKKSITLVTEDGTYLRLGDGQVNFGMKAQFVVRTSSFILQGPSTLSIDLPHFSETSFDDAFVVKDQGGALVARMKYRLTHMDGGVIEGITGDDAKIPMQKGVGPDSVTIELLGLQS